MNPYQIKIKIDELQYIVLLKPNDVITALQNQESIKGLKYSNKTLEEIEISFREFIPSVDNYNIKIPYLISNYIQGDRNIFYK